MTPKATSRALKDLKGFGLIDFEKGKNGEKIMIKVKDLLPTFWEGDLDTTKGDKDISKVEKVSTPPLSKELSKELIKEDKFDFETFRKNWFSCKEDNEPLRKQLYNRFDLAKVEPIYNSLTLEQQKQVCLGTKRFIQYLQNNPNKVEWIKNASNYILKEEYKVHFKAINDEIRAENNRLEREAYLKEADRNKASDSERKKILLNWKK